MGLKLPLPSCATDSVAKLSSNEASTQKEDTLTITDENKKNSLTPNSENNIVPPTIVPRRYRSHSFRSTLPRTKAPFLPPKPSVQEKKPDNADSELQNKLNRRLKRIDSNVTLDEPAKKNMSDSDGPNPELLAKLQWRKSREFN
jgi:hypothetical protein